MRETGCVGAEAFRVEDAAPGADDAAGVGRPGSERPDVFQ